MYEKEMKKLMKLYEDGIFSQPFYADKIAGAQDFESYENFSKIPFMYKDDLRNTKPFDRTSATTKDVYGIFSSSGTTGSKTFYVYSKKDKKVYNEFVKAFYSELGVNERDLGGVFAPVDTGVMAHSMMWQFTTMGSGYVNCPEPSPDNMIDFVKALPITIIATRPGVVCSIADNPQYVKSAGESNVRMLLLGGGFMTEGRRKYIEKMWNASCYSMFGMSEVFGPMAGECRYQDGLHYLDKYLLIEVLDPVTHTPVAPGEYGVAVYTTLWDKGFPLLRYWTDDYIAVDTSPCRCGRDLPRFRYKGRLADCLEVKGQYVFPRMLEECLFKYGFEGEYRALQEKENRIKVVLEKRDGYSVSPGMKKEIDELFMNEVAIEFVPKEKLAYDGHAIRFIKENG